jgi:6-phosphogluconolactonase
MKTTKAWIRIAVISSIVLLAAACGGGGSSGGGGGGGNNVTVPNVVGMTQAAATTAIGGAGLAVGSVTMASSSSVASGSVISENPAAGTSVASGSAVALTVSSGPAQVAVPNVVGSSAQSYTKTITNSGLVVGTVTMVSSTTVASGNVISQSPAAGTMVNSGSAVNLTVSSGPPPGNHYAYVANAGDPSISAFKLDASTGALTAVGAAMPVTGAPTGLQEIRIDPSNKYVYVVSQGDDSVYGYSINADGSLTAIAGSPFGTGIKPQSMAFDSTGAFLYVLNVTGNGSKQSSISMFSVTAATGVLTSLGTTRITAVGAGSLPAQIVTVKSSLYVALTTASAVDLFTINADGSLTESTDPNAPYPTDTGAYGLAVDPSGTVLYTANAGSGSGSISSFKINADGSLTSFCDPNPCALPIPAYGDIGIDPQGKYLFVTEQVGGNGSVDVYPINAAGPTGLDPAVANSPFSTGGNKPNSVSFDSSGKYVFTGNDASANFAEFTLNAATGALTPVTGSPIAAGNNPDFIAVN